MVGLLLVLALIAYGGYRSCRTLTHSLTDSLINRQTETIQTDRQTRQVE
jgi:hypothetical protein